MLIIAQALLFAMAIIPIWLFTKRRLGRAPAYFLSLAYAIFWGVQSAVAFDFHEIAFAVPLIATLIYLTDIKKWRWVVLVLALLLLVKEDLSFFVIFYGIYVLIAQKQWKIGLGSIILGLTWFIMATKVFIPHFAGPGAAYTYWTYGQFGADPISSLRTVITKPSTLWMVISQPTVKLSTILHLFTPFALLSLASPIILLATPLILERFLSENYLYWLQVFHYSATVTPVLVMAAAAGIYNLTRPIKNEKTRNWTRVSLSALVLVLNIRLLPLYPLSSLAKPEFYRLTDNQRIGYQAIQMIPAEASVAAQDSIIPHLSERESIYQLKPGFPSVDYIIASQSLSPWPNTDYAQIESLLQTSQDSGCKDLFNDDGWIVLKCN